MTWLLDVSTLVARLVQSHEHHQRVNAWWSGHLIAVCPITELGVCKDQVHDARTALEYIIKFVCQLAVSDDAELI